MLLLETALATFMIIDSNSTHKPTARPRDHETTAHGLSHPAVNAYHLADYAYLAIFRTNDDGAHVRVCRLQADVILLPVKPFESHLTINHSNYGILVIGSRLWSNQSQIAIEDTCVDH